MYGLQPWRVRATCSPLETGKRPAALGSLDDDYHCIITLPGPNAVPACANKKIARVWKTHRERPFFDVGNWTARAKIARPFGLKALSLRVVPAGLLLAGRSGWVWVRWMADRAMVVGLSAGRVIGDQPWAGRILSIAAEFACHRRGVSPF
jgi:hypothetical protein